MVEKVVSRGIPGRTVVLGLAAYDLAPITLGQFFTLEDDFDKLVGNEDKTPPVEREGNMSARFRLVAKFVLVSLRRNYDKVVDGTGNLIELTEDVLLNDLLDWGNREIALTAALTVSGLELPGEAMPVRVAGESRSPDSSTNFPLPTVEHTPTD